MCEFNLDEAYEQSEYSNDGLIGTIGNTHVTILIKHFDQLIKITKDFPCKSCGGEGRMRNPRNPIFLPTLDCKCGGTGKEYKGLY